MRGNVHSATINNSSQRSVDNSNMNKISRPTSKAKSSNDSSIKLLMTSCFCGIFITIIFVAFGTMSGFITVSNITSTTERTNLMRGEKASALSKSDDSARVKELESIRQQNRGLLDRLAKAEKKLEQKLSEKSVPNNAPETSDTSKLNSRISRLTQKSDRMREMIQLLSKRHLIEKYGEGPHYVEMLLSIDPKSNIADNSKESGEDTEILLIKMAPIDDMPATVFWFLEQVNATIFDGSSFHRNAHHVVQGGPTVNFETTDRGRSFSEKISKTGLDSIPFQE